MGPRGSSVLLPAALLLLLVLLGLLQVGPRGSQERPSPAGPLQQPSPSLRRQQQQQQHHQVTYIRSSRLRGHQGTACCRLQGAPANNGGSSSSSSRKISCNHMNVKEHAGIPDNPARPWSVCLDDRFNLVHQIKKKQCRLYSLGLGSDDNQFEISMANSGCEVHRFDPSIQSAHVREGQHLWYHRLSIDWRDPNPMIAAHKLRINTKKLGTILNDFGHHKGLATCGSWAGADPWTITIDVLKADMESAEWKILENLILEDIVERIGQLVFEIHVHWPGFEVSGNDSTVVRYWYSLLKELELKNFRLFHTYRDLLKPQVFLKSEAFNASSCYTLSWVNTRWK
ncbi:methyltransferase-like protein 24 isoform X4 [Sceloporus undulatus]|uniref:methyltransferase-like protein 24 isoform X4 n=1 Tax=Sceloporus undulatus TaxID=8520 RepID=UPI001C4D61EA|nr:methyltransferase-like protein 24 isoform X4 [Sceloporus undulatus]